MSDKETYQRPTEKQLVDAIDEYADKLVDLNTTEKTFAGGMIAAGFKKKVVDLLQRLLYPPRWTRTETHNKIMALVDEYGIRCYGEGSNAANREKTPNHNSDATRQEISDLVEAAIRPPFIVKVLPMPASNGVTYLVILDRADRPEGAGPWDNTGRITPINRNDVREANEEATTWAKFLGVPFVPREPYTGDFSDIPSTVPEYGDSVRQSK